MHRKNETPYQFEFTWTTINSWCLKRTKKTLPPQLCDKKTQKNENSVRPRVFDHFHQQPLFLR